MPPKRLEDHVALLRGINVGGKNPLPMAALVGIFEGCGVEGVRTYIQSGNVLFRATAEQAQRAAAAAAGRIRAQFGYDLPILLRSRGELGAVLGANPFLAAPAVNPAELHAMFLAHPPSPQQISTLDPARSPPDAFAVVGSTVYLRCPNGLGRSKLSNDYFDRRLGTRSTVRNWATVSKLHELAHAAD
jgi:uncharacterized protein (DUF1697 family)